jgi:hypothetical protein
LNNNEGEQLERKSEGREGRAAREELAKVDSDCDKKNEAFGGT